MYKSSNVFVSFFLALLGTLFLVPGMGFSSPDIIKPGIVKSLTSDNDTRKTRPNSCGQYMDIVNSTIS